MTSVGRNIHAGTSKGIKTGGKANLLLLQGEAITLLGQLLEFRSVQAGDFTVEPPKAIGDPRQRALGLAKLGDVRTKIGHPPRLSPALLAIPCSESLAPGHGKVRLKANVPDECNLHIAQGSCLANHLSLAQDWPESIELTLELAQAHAVIDFYSDYQPRWCHHSSAQAGAARPTNAKRPPPSSSDGSRPAGPSSAIRPGGPTR